MYHHYKIGGIQAVRKALSERGVAMPDGHCSPILAPFAGQQEKSSPGPLVIASKSGPLNGQGPLTTAFDFYRGTELDVHLVIYLVEPFTQVRR
uniref:TPP_enzyme_N domain-containing protein n=1 Tax=Mesocestoides corti TaxID=53468 RepID=A0A5K3FAI9_MESCO